MTQDLVVLKDPKSPISEIFRTIRTNIQFMDAKKQAKLILVTSAYAGEGKSWISSNLAVAFAQAGKKVLLIDADMRKGRQSRIFKVSQKPGLSNYLSGVDDDEIEDKNLTSYIQKTEIKGLYILSSGSIPPNPSELLILPQMKEMLEQVKEVCDIVIIDGTPSQLVTDSLILSTIVDSTIIVTAHNETKKEGLKRIITNIENVGGRILGVVLNKIPIEAKEYEQAYYYNSREKKNKDKEKEKYVPKRTATITPSTYLDNQSDDLFKNVKKSKNKPDGMSDETYKSIQQIDEYFKQKAKK